VQPATHAKQSSVNAGGAYQPAPAQGVAAPSSLAPPSSSSDFIMSIAQAPERGICHSGRCFRPQRLLDMRRRACPVQGGGQRPCLQTYSQSCGLPLPLPSFGPASTEQPQQLSVDINCSACSPCWLAPSGAARHPETLGQGWRSTHTALFRCTNLAHPPCQRTHLCCMTGCIMHIWSRSTDGAMVLVLQGVRPSSALLPCRAMLPWSLELCCWLGSAALAFDMAARLAELLTVGMFMWVALATRL